MNAWRLALGFAVVIWLYDVTVQLLALDLEAQAFEPWTEVHDDIVSSRQTSRRSPHEYKPESLDKDHNKWTNLTSQVGSILQRLYDEECFEERDRCGYF